MACKTFVSRPGLDRGGAMRTAENPDGHLQFAIQRIGESKRQSGECPGLPGALQPSYELTRLRKNKDDPISALNSRIGSSSFARCNSLARSRHIDLPATQSILDYPDENHTSPTSTPDSVMFFPLQVALNSRSSEEAFNGSSLRLHLPSLSASVFFVCPANSTVTTSPGLAQPQTRNLHSTLQDRIRGKG